MLYCPKCNRTYEEGTQRFCSDDGVRLLGQSAPPRAVFSNLYKPREEDAAAPAAAAAGEDRQSPVQLFPKPEPKKRIFEPVDAFNPDKNIGAVKNEQTPETTDPGAKPLPRLIRANEIPPSQAKLGDRRADPGGGRAAPLTWENTEILLGQTVKGRYRIAEQLSTDETSVAYLAEDKIVAGKKVVVRVMMDEKTGDAEDESAKIYAEERVSLSHVNHPNIASLLDSGALPEGKNFIVSEYVEGDSLRDMLRHSGTFNPLRAARVIRQVAHALSEAHGNGILHRSLRPDHIVLTISEAGKELVKVTNFAVFDGFDEPNEETIKYLAPEQLEGRLPNFASDIYSLAVIAYQMLTGRLPFNSAASKELLRSQKEGLSLRPTNLRLDLPPAVDEILEKSLSYHPGERFPKARDFGDAFYNALTTTAFWEQPAVEQQSKEEKFPAVIVEPIEAATAAAAPVKTFEAEEKENKARQGEPPSSKRGVPEIEKTAAPVAAAPPALPPLSAPEKNIPAHDDEIRVEEKKDAGKSRKASEVVILPAASAAAAAAVEVMRAEEKKTEETKEIKTPKAQAQPSQDLLWEKRSPEPLQQASTSRSLLFALLLLLLGVGAWAAWSYFSSRPVDQVYVPPVNNQNAAGANNEPQNNAANDGTGNSAPIAPPPAEIEAPPLPRKINQPPNTVYFQTSKENVRGDLAKNFRGFSFYYPDDWTKNTTDTHFIDVARVGATGTPIEQFLVTYYESRGTFSADRENFPQLVEKSSQDLKQALGGTYTLVWHGETKINGEWKAYEMKFQREGVTKNGDKITLWGRRLWIPAARPGVRSGFVITMLATSLSPEVKSAEDVGVKGELAPILDTFEPVSLDAAY